MFSARAAAQAPRFRAPKATDNDGQQAGQGSLSCNMLEHMKAPLLIGAKQSS